MRGNEQDFSTVSQSNSPPKNNGDLLSMLADVSAKLDAVLADNAAMRDEWERMKEQHGADFDPAHASHVLDRFFKHDRPAPEPEPPKVAKFDPYTGERLAA